MIHVVGHKGQLGQSLMALQNHKVIPAGALQSGDIIINCAAKTNHNICIADPDAAWDSNVDLVRQLVKKARDSNCFLIHISTDYVFSDDTTIPSFVEDDERCPPIGNVYAQTKVVGELQLQISNFENWICVRSGWLMSPFRRAEWLSMPQVWDQYGTPVWAPNLAEALIDLCHNIHIVKKRKFYHFSANQISSRLELATHYADKKVLTVPAPIDRPYCSALRNTMIEWRPKPLSPFEVIDEYKKVHGVA